MSRRELNRRQFLRGTNGLVLALPFLESLAPKALAQTPPVVKRFVAVVAPNGYMEPVYYPSVAADTKISDHLYYKPLSTISGPLSECLGTTFDSLRPKMNIIRGLDIAGAFGHTPVSALCSARRKINGDNSPIDPVGDCRSIDVVLGHSSSFYSTTPSFKALRAIEPGGLPMSIDRDALGNTIQIPYTTWPYDMFQQVFSSLNLTDAQAAAMKAKKTTVGDLVLTSYKNLLNNSRISANDKNLVSNFVTQVQDLNNKVNATPLSCSTPNISKASSNYYNLLPEAERAGLTSQFIDIMVSAMACDLTRVAVISLGNDNYRHGVSHEDLWNRDTQLKFVEIMKKYQNNVVKEFATKMNSINESNGKTMLDNSLLLWGMEQSAGNAHCNMSMPAITFGSMDGALKTGYYMDARQRPFKHYANRQDIFPPFGSETYNQLMNTIFKGLGVPASEYEKYGDGGGFGSLDTKNILTYLNGEYDLLLAKRKLSLPFLSLV